MSFALSRRRLVVQSVVVRLSWLNGDIRCETVWLTNFKCSRNSEPQLRKWPNQDSSWTTERADSRWLPSGDSKARSPCWFWPTKCSKVDWSYRVPKRNLSCSSRRRTTSGDRQLHHEQLLKQNRDLRKAHGKSLNEMEEMKRFQASTLTWMMLKWILWRKSCSPTIVITPIGEVQWPQCTSKNLIFLTMKVLEKNFSSSIARKAMWWNGYSYEWMNGQKPHLIKTGFEYNVTRRTSFWSWFQACHRVLPPTFLLQCQWHFQDRKLIILHLLQARLPHQPQLC